MNFLKTVITITTAMIAISASHVSAQSLLTQSTVKVLTNPNDTFDEADIPDIIMIEGFVVGPRHILTARHGINQNHPGRSYVIAGDKYFEIERIIAASSFWNIQKDYALLILAPKNLENLPPPMDLRIVDDADEIFLAPAEEKPRLCRTLETHAILRDLVKRSCPSWKGNSGAPLVTLVNGIPKAIGINTRGDGVVSQGIQFTEPIGREIRNWISYSP